MIKQKTPSGSMAFFRISANIVRAVYAGEAVRPEYSALGLTPCEDGSGLEEKKTPDGLYLSAGRLALSMETAAGKITWKNAETGTVLFAEERRLRPVPVLKTTTGGEPPVIKKIKTVDGERTVAENLRTFTDRMAYEGELRLTLPEGTSLHGLGQGEDGVYDYHDHVQYLYQHNMRIPVPFLVTNQGFGLLVDCGSPMVFESRGDTVVWKLDAVEQLDCYVIAGDTLDEILAGMRQLTGDAPLLPKWAYGYWQSKEAYTTQEELVQVAEEYRRRGVPLDCVVQDWNSWRPGLWGDKHLDPARYPDMADASRRLHAMNVHSVVSIWPNMAEGAPDHEEMAQAGALLGDLSTYDAFQPAARALYWKQLTRELVPAGFDGWWCDSTEPFTGPDWCGEKKRPEEERYRLVAGEHKKFLDATQANLYAMRHAQGIWEGQRASCPDRRVVNLTRSGCAGSQRYGTILWSGDISASWDTMRKQLAEGLNLCMSGLPYWTLDAGGFFTVKDDYTKRGCGSSGNPNPLWFWAGEYNDGCHDPRYRELYTRWLQYAVFLPVFRSHGTDTPREIWNFGEKGTMFYDAIEAAIRLRYRLMPYVYSLAAAVTLDRATILRSLLFDFPEDPTAASLSDEFLFGKSLLVCPVTEPMYCRPEGEAGEKVRRCWLPQGADWYDFETDRLCRGGQYVEAQAPISRIPVFVRAGSILPMESGLSYASQETGAPFEIHVYPGRDGSFLLYEDDGDGWDYESGRYNRIALRWDDAGSTLTIGGCENVFPQGILGRELLLIRHGEAPVRRTVTYRGEEESVRLA